MSTARIKYTGVSRPDFKDPFDVTNFPLPFPLNQLRVGQSVKFETKTWQEDRWLKEAGQDLADAGFEVKTFGEGQVDASTAEDVKNAFEDPSVSYVALEDDMESNGIKTEDDGNGRDFEVDLAGNSLQLAAPGTGSPGYTNSALWFGKNTNVTIKDGEVSSADIKILIQNYSNLTLDNVHVVVSGTNTYGVSCNYGNTVLKNGTVIDVQNEATAIDCYFGLHEDLEDPGVTVTVADTSVKVNGKIAYRKDERVEDEQKFLTNAHFYIPAGYSLAAPEGFKWEEAGSGKQELRKQEA